MVRSSRAPAKSRSGCLPLVVMCALTCLLLTINAVLTHSALGPLVRLLPDMLRKPKMEQALLFVLPVLLTFLEWWVLDWLGYAARRPAESKRGESRGPTT